MLESLRDQGGVCMVTFVPKFVNQACADWHRSAVEAAAAEGIAEADSVRFSPWYAAHRAAHPEPVADLSDVVAHCEHVREVAGIEHVGLGGDYDGVEVLPPGSRTSPATRGCCPRSPTGAGRPTTWPG